MNAFIVHRHPFVHEQLGCWLVQVDPSMKVIALGGLEDLPECLLRGESVGLLVLDRDLPELEDWRGIARARSLCPGSPLLVLTSDCGPAVARECVDAGADLLLRKSLPTQHLRRSIQELIRSHAGLARNTQPARRSASSPGLTQRQIKLLHMLDQGLLTHEMAVSLKVQPNTVRSHLYRLFKRLNARTRLQALHVARLQGWI